MSDSLVGPAFGLASTLIGATAKVSAGNTQAGSYTARAASFDAAADNAEIAGNQAIATAQRKGFIARDQATLLNSRARALAAAGGGSSADVGVQNLMAGITGQGEYNAMSALYEGQEANRQYQYQAWQDRTQAANDRSQAGAARSAGYLSAGATLIGGASSLWDKYGKDLFPASGPSAPAGGYYDAGTSVGSYG